MITSCNHSENIICGSCLMKNHQEKQVAENLLRGELLRRTLPYLEASLLGRLYSEMQGAHENKALHKALRSACTMGVKPLGQPLAPFYATIISNR